MQVLVQCPILVISNEPAMIASLGTSFWLPLVFNTCLCDSEEPREADPKQALALPGRSRLETWMKISFAGVHCEHR